MVEIVVDVVLVGLMLIALIIGIRRGFIASLGAIVGLVVGALAAFWLAPLLNDLWPWQDTRVIAVIALVLVLVGACSMTGAIVGNSLRRGVDQRTPLRLIDRLFGGALAVVAAALTLVLGVSAVPTGTPGLSAALASSRVMQAINSVTPQPVAEAVARVRTAVLDDGLPRLGELLDIGIEPSSPPVSQDDPALGQAAASVARVSGTAFACGMSQTGTGFVIAPNRILTNAHVVAGVETPVIELPGQPAREGWIVFFDPIDDLAVIAVDELGVAALPLAGPVPVGTAGVVQGYPYGGPFTMTGAEVISTGAAQVPDIYEETTALRQIYALAGEVLPGNSGGPLLTAGGEVAGVVFARAEADSTRGYAMTTAEVQPVRDMAAGLSEQVPSGHCTT